jgi:20S proteasome alpha/beta subunit
VTCIVGIAQDNQVTIGGDSAGVGGYSLQLRADTKVFRTGNYVMGDGVRKILSDGGWLHNSNGIESGGTFLVGVRGALYEIQSDFQAGRTLNGYVAVGCGEDLALGALHATAHSDLPPRARVEAALRAAEHHSAGVAAPFAYEVLP